jgi:acetoin utilization deacetylase AcuC-like enzyme
MQVITRYLICLIVALNSLSLLANNNSSRQKVAVLYSDKFLLHDTGPNHPESPERLSEVVNDIKINKLLSPFIYWPSIKKANIEDIGLVHTKDYIDLVTHEISLIKGNITSYLSTGDTAISKDSNDVAKLAVGAGILGADEVMKGKASSAFALVRPPGHHATASRGMGFCIYNNIAIAARHLQHKYGLTRLLIVDFDVHHGNGTQDIFYDDDSVFYFSVHQHPFYPQSGRPSETGSAKGKGFTLNVDLPRGSGDVDLLDALKNQLYPAMEKFRPEFILVSAGFDAHEGDLLGQLNYTSKGYEQVAVILKDIAKKHASGRSLYMLEGGYIAKNISKSVNEILEVLIKTD